MVGKHHSFLPTLRLIDIEVDPVFSHYKVITNTLIQAFSKYKLSFLLSKQVDRGWWGPGQVHSKEPLVFQKRL